MLKYSLGGSIGFMKKSEVVLIPYENRFKKGWTDVSRRAALWKAVSVAVEVVRTK